MKIYTLFLAIAFCLLITGCGSKDAEINAFLTDWDSITNELAQKLKAGDMDGAKTLFDAKKEMLKTKWTWANKAKKFQVSEATRQRMKESRTKNSAAMEGTMDGILMMKTPPDRAEFNKHKAILEEYQEIFRFPLEEIPSTRN